VRPGASDLVPLARGPPRRGSSRAARPRRWAPGRCLRAAINAVLIACVLSNCRAFFLNCRLIHPLTN